MARASVGTSGFNYPHWRGVLYPEGVPTRAWLEHYAARYGCVELNVTFYRLPAPSTFAGWARRTPQDFQFVLKGSRFITHVKRLREPFEAVRRFFEASEPLGDKLACVLWQLPPDMPADLDRLAGFLGALRDTAALERCRHAFEFRNLGWFVPEVFHLLAQARCCVAHTDWPVQVVPPRVPFRLQTRQLQRRARVRAPFTADFVYLRRHGPGERYRSGYAPAMLRSESRWVRRWLAEGRDVLAFFNNDWGGHAVRDAARLAQLVGSAHERDADAADGSAQHGVHGSPAPLSRRTA
ncbi:MAG: DUF72 domain-containing protein [Halobacteriales archaeon]|nr:DUF72 domain-containing protein [Halobacteriales archaeon]